MLLLRASRACVRSYKGMRPLSGFPGAWAKARSGRSARACDAHEVPGRQSMNSSGDSASAGTIGGARSKLRSSSCCRQIWCVTTCVRTAPCARGVRRQPHRRPLPGKRTQSATLALAACGVWRAPAAALVAIALSVSAFSLSASAAATSGCAFKPVEVAMDTAGSLQVLRAVVHRCEHLRRALSPFIRALRQKPHGQIAELSRDT